MAPQPTSPPTTVEEPDSASSTASSAASDPFISDPGPVFDPEHLPTVDELYDDEPPGLIEQAVEGWHEHTVRELLTTQGHLTHMLLRVDAAGDEDTWKHTEDDLSRIAPPLTRMLNRYDATRAAAAAGDEISLVSAVSVYATRNYLARRRLIAHVRATTEPVPVSGVAPGDLDGMPVQGGPVADDVDELVDETRRTNLPPRRR